MRWRSLILGLVVVGLTQIVSGGSARADYTTTPQSFGIPLTPTNWGSNTSSLTGLDPLAIEKFNPADYSTGGKTAVLLGVQVQVDYEFQNTLSMQFYNMSTITVSATGSLSMENTKGVAFLTSTPFVNSQTLTASPSTILGGKVTFPTQTYTGSMSSPTGGFTGATTLQNFTGTGTIALPVVASASSTFSTSSGNGYGSSVTEALAHITIVYRYALVPEPSSLLLVGLGCFGVFGVCRQKSRLNRLKAACRD